MKAVIFLASAIVLLSGSLSAQGMLRMYRMMYSVGGSFSSGQNDLDIKGTTGSTGSELDHETVRLSTRNGYFISRNVVFGFEFTWDQTRGESRPKPNPTNARYKNYDRNLFVGPLLRWYLPLSMRWFTYPEISVGYRHYLGESEASSSTVSTLPVTISARGFGANAGLGLGYFISRNVVLDASLRYSYNWHTGSYEIPGQPDLDVDFHGSEIGILLGLELLM
ncbi:MAG: outer membrane beta-barrel protein [Bacteroidetes bacterium]|nr:outer membrane beta-barrel protein [Bacteroidota bacterium]